MSGALMLSCLLFSLVSLSSRSQNSKGGAQSYKLLQLPTMDSLLSDVEKHCSKQILKDKHDDHCHPYHYQEQQNNHHY